MTVPAVRFESLSRDFNLPQTSFQSIRDSEILNAPLDAIKEGLESAKGLLSQLKETAKNAMSKEVVLKLKNSVYKWKRRNGDK